MRFIFRINFLLFAGFLFSTGTQFLTIPANGLELSLGASAVLENSINPASLKNNGSGPLLGVSHGSWLTDTKASSLDIRFPGANRSFGLQIKYVNLNDLELRTERPTDDPLAYFGAGGFTIGGSGSWEIMDMKIGAGLRYIRMDIYSENSQGIAVDFGFTKQMSSGLNIGFAALNVGSMSKLQNEKPALPLRVISGAGYIFSLNRLRHNVNLGAEWSSLVEGVILRASSETSWQGISLRLGSKLSANVREFSGGVGFRFGIYGLNYGIRLGSQNLGIPQMIDLTVQLP